MKKTIFTLALLAISSTCMWAQWGQPADPNAALGMKDTYKDYFTILSRLPLSRRSSTASLPRTT